MIPKVPEHGRTKPKRNSRMSADERQFAAWVCRNGCEICGYMANFHHQPYKSREGWSHSLGVALCPRHHSPGKESVHGMNVEPFNKRYGVDLDEIAERNRSEYFAEP